MVYEDDFIDIKESVFVRALDQFDSDLINMVLIDNCQSLDDLLICAASSMSRIYFDFMRDLCKKIDELMIEDIKQTEDVKDE